MQLFLDGLFTQSEHFCVQTELIIVEWNPPADQLLLADALRWPTAHEHCQIRIITVPKAIHDQYNYAERLPLFQMIAKNVGLRRAAGEFILVTNIDILLSDELFAFIASDQLKPGHIYRVDRLDVDQSISSSLSHEERLDYCRNNIVRINDRYKSLFIKTGETSPIYPEETREYFSMRFGRITALHTNACGDFQLMSKEDWFKVRGYAELEYYSLHLDSVLEINAHYEGANEYCLEPPLAAYHIEHESGWKPETRGFEAFKEKFSQIKRMSNDELFYINRLHTARKSAFILNNEHWGMAEIDLPEVCIDQATSAIVSKNDTVIKLNKGIDRLALGRHLAGFYAFKLRVTLARLLDQVRMLIRLQAAKTRIHQDYKIAIFGAGISGTRLHGDLKNRNIPIHYFIDNNDKLRNTEVDGIPVISPKHEKDILTSIDTIILGSLHFNTEMKQQLKSMGYKGQII
jgi:hypothetical protein